MKVTTIILTLIFFTAIIIEDRAEVVKPFSAEDFKHFKEKKAENSKYWKAVFNHESVK